MPDVNYEYYKAIEEMRCFIKEYDVYLYSVLFRYASKYNYAWKCALCTDVGKKVLFGSTKQLLEIKKKNGTLPKDNPLLQFEEYDRLIAELPDDMLIEIPFVKDCE